MCTREDLANTVYRADDFLVNKAARNNNVDYIPVPYTSRLMEVILHLSDYFNDSGFCIIKDVTKTKRYNFFSFATMSLN